MEDPKLKQARVLWDGAEVERLREVRRAIERRYKTLDGLCAHLKRLERQDRHRKYARLPQVKISSREAEKGRGTGLKEGAGK